MKNPQKSIGQVTYEKRGMAKIHGPWSKAPNCVREAFDEDADIAIAEFCRRLIKLVETTSPSCK